jgi:hypothetical protein
MEDNIQRDEIMGNESYYNGNRLDRLQGNYFLTTRRVRSLIMQPLRLDSTFSYFTSQVHKFKKEIDVFNCYPLKDSQSRVNQ